MCQPFNFKSSTSTNIDSCLSYKSTHHTMTHYHTIYQRYSDVGFTRSANKTYNRIPGLPEVSVIIVLFIYIYGFYSMIIWFIGISQMIRIQFIGTLNLTIRFPIVLLNLTVYKKFLL